MNKKVSAFAEDALGRMDAVAIVAAIKEKKVSAAEITIAAIKRAEKVNPELNAISLPYFDDAKKNIENLPQGDLYGVPTFIKDNENVKGYPTQFGTKAFTAINAKKNSSFVDQFLSTGLNSLGKSTLPEFGLICSTENPKWGITRNPWNTDFTTGGSSSGSAALVASGVVPIALANDGAGSTRIPASCCGLIGLKPSRNRLINFDGSNLLPVNIGYEGVLTRSVRDTALFYAAAEKYYKNKELPEMGYIQEPIKKRLKIAAFENPTAGKMGHLDSDTQAAVATAIQKLTYLGHTVEVLPFPLDIDFLYGHFLNYYGFLAFVQKNLGRFLLKTKVDHSQLENFTNGISKQFSQNVFTLNKSLKILKEQGMNVEKSFDNFDILITPVLSHNTPLIGHFDPSLPYEEIAKRAVGFASYTGLQNITGAPAISLPVASSGNGMPIGIQFIAPLGKDALLLELAYEIEQAFPWESL